MNHGRTILNKYIGSSLDDFLIEEGILEHCEEKAKSESILQSKEEKSVTHSEGEPMKPKIKYVWNKDLQCYLEDITTEKFEIDDGLIEEIYPYRSPKEPNRGNEVAILMNLLMFDGDFNFVNENLDESDFTSSECREIYSIFRVLKRLNNEANFEDLKDVVDLKKYKSLFEEMRHKHLPDADIQDGWLKDTVKRIVERNWMKRRENIRRLIQNGKRSDDEVTELMKEFNHLIRNPPKVL